MPMKSADDVVVAEYQELEVAQDFDAGDPVALDLLLAQGTGDDLHDDDLAETEIRQPTAGGFDEAEAVGYDEFADDEVPVPAAPARRGRPKGSTPAPEVSKTADFTKETSVYQRLIDYGLLKKLTDIVLAKVTIPWHLREDATQEIHVYWAGLVARPQFQKNQFANFAYMAGKHAALKLRRNIGAVVTIPGAAFRSGRDSAFMQSIGAAVNPKDIDDYKDSMELSIVPELPAESWINERFFFERMEGLTLSAKQRQVAYKALVERQTTEDISMAMSMPIMYVERLLNQVTVKIEARDLAIKKGLPVEPAAPAKKGRKHKGGPGPSAKPYTPAKRNKAAVDQPTEPSAE